MWCPCREYVTDGIQRECNHGAQHIGQFPGNH
jgi:hypothetical protein